MGLKQIPINRANVANVEFQKNLCGLEATPTSSMPRRWTAFQKDLSGVEATSSATVRIADGRFQTDLCRIEATQSVGTVPSKKSFQMDYCGIEAVGKPIVMQFTSPYNRFRALSSVALS